MKRKMIVVSTIVLSLLLVAGVSFAWFTSDKSATNEFKMGTVDVIVVEEFPEGGYSEVTTGETYTKEVQVKSLGSKKTYVRVRLVPEWSDPSLSVSNVNLNLATNQDWTVQQPDGYYYFRYYLTTNQITSKLLDSVEFTELGEEYEGAKFILKVVAEGVQTTNNAWQVVWNLTTLPFTPNQPWTP